MGWVLGVVVLPSPPCHRVHPGRGLVEHHHSRLPHEGQPHADAPAQTLRQRPDGDVGDGGGVHRHGGQQGGGGRVLREVETRCNLTKQITSTKCKFLKCAEKSVGIFDMWQKFYCIAKKPCYCSAVTIQSSTIFQRISLRILSSYLPAPASLEPPVEPEVLPGCEIRVEDAVLRAQSQRLLHLGPAVPHRHAEHLHVPGGGILQAGQQLAARRGNNVFFLKKRFSNQINRYVEQIRKSDPAKPKGQRAINCHPFGGKTEGKQENFSLTWSCSSPPRCGPAAPPPPPRRSRARGPPPLPWSRTACTGGGGTRPPRPVMIREEEASGPRCHGVPPFGFEAHENCKKVIFKLNVSIKFQILKLHLNIEIIF